MPHPSHERYFEANRANWDDRVPVHVASRGYDMDGFLRGEKTLYDIETSEVGDVRGKTLLHLQCHFGMDTLGWARLGARVTGLDFSAPAVEQARALAARIGIEDARFVEANVYDALEALSGEQFDVVYTGVGALGWLPDIKGWARVAAGLVKPGGFLYVYEGHPALWSMDDTRDDGALVVADPYFERPEPSVWDEAVTYVDGPSLEHTRTYEWNHGLGEIVTAVIEAGLHLAFVHEHRTIAWKALPQMVAVEPESMEVAGGHQRRTAWQLPEEQRDLLPLMYSLKAIRPPA
jgi:SAM-dependent methyltransferase